MNIKIKRAYEQPHKDDGLRILVDRLSPRGLTKEEASVDLWLKEIAPSTELRKWFAHDPDKWKRFRGRYETEIGHNHELLKVLKEKARKGTITLSFGSYDIWKADFVGIGKMRGVGWAICYENPANGRLSNHWITLHETGNVAG